MIAVPAYFMNLGNCSVKLNTISNIFMGSTNITLGTLLGYYFGSIGVVTGYAISLIFGRVLLVYLNHAKDGIGYNFILNIKNIIYLLYCMIIGIFGSLFVNTEIIEYNVNLSVQVKIVGLLGLLLLGFWFNPAKNYLISEFRNLNI